MSGTGILDLNSPEIPKSGVLPGGKPPVRAIKDEYQCQQVVYTLENDNRDRNIKAARIMSKYNADRPWPQSALVADGLGWKHNFSTQPLPVLVDKIAPRFWEAVAAAKYLTSSALPDTIPGASRKTEAYRREFTDLVRARPTWQDFVEEVAQENALFGYTGAGWLDETSWFPTHFRGDRFLVPQGTRQLACEAPVVAFVEYYDPHELFEKIRDKEAAIEAGWNIQNTVEAINTATVPTIRSQWSSETARLYEDLARESNLALSLTSGTKKVIVYNVLVYEINGKVTHWKVRYPDFKRLFVHEDRFDCMSDVAAFFSFQKANGTMHGSKGVGRIVYQLANELDKARNEVLDRLQLSGKIVVQGDPKQMRRFKMTVFGNAILLNSGFQVLQQRIDPRTEEFFRMDQYLSGLIDQLSGNVSPRQLQGERVTAKQVELFAAREEEGKDNVITRFVKQMSGCLSTMQRRLGDKRVDEDDAKAFRKKMLALMSEEEFEYLTNQPSARLVRDLSEIERQQVVLAATENQGNPLVDQEQMLRRKLTAQVDEQFAEAVMLSANDPTKGAEQIRLQTMENMLLGAGQQVPVSARDGHIFHLDVMQAPIQELLDSLVQSMENLPILKLFVAHARQHIQMGVATSENQEAFAEAAGKLDVIEERLRALEAQEQVIQEGIEGGLTPEQATLAVSGAPPGV